MSFRKRNVALGDSSRRPATTEEPSKAPSISTPQYSYPLGVRPSLLNGKPTTSTGTQSLDDLLAGHAGLVLGNSLLIEENGATDYAGTLLRLYAAEGIVQGHKVHVVGVGQQWGRELPGCVEHGRSHVGVKVDEAVVREKTEKMKIAWRYEKLGEFGGGASRARGSPLPDRSAPDAPSTSPSPVVFCHSFDLTQRLTLSPSNPINFLPIPPVNHATSPFQTLNQSLSHQISSSPLGTVHRLLIPNLLSPAFYPPHASNPQNILQFLHSLRALLRKHPTQLTAMMSLPLTLYPRSTGLVRWMEILADGVLELAPFPHSVDASRSSGAATAQEEKPHGMVKVHCLPVFHENGGGGAGNGGFSDDMAFTVSRKRFTIKPFSLPPVEGDNEAQKGEAELNTSKLNIDF